MLIERLETVTPTGATRAVLLDAVGTVLELRRPVADYYAEAAQAAGIEVAPTAIRQRFPAAFTRYFAAWQNHLPADWAQLPARWQTAPATVESWLGDPEHRAAFRRQFQLPADEHRERQNWSDLVTEILGDAAGPNPPSAAALATAFDRLWELFARPDTWSVIAAATPLIERLQRQGIAVYLASNFDQRLLQVVAGQRDALPVDGVFTSAAVGYRKPDPRFYDTLLQQLRLAPEQVCMIGDRWWEDYAAPRTCGLTAHWYHPPKS